MRRGLLHQQDRLSTVQVKAVGARNLWHGHLGHPSDQVLSLFYKNLNLSSSLENNVKGPCDVCCRAKETRTKFSASESHAKDLFELIHCDIWGAYRVPSLCGAQYFLTIVDDASRAVWVYLMRAKGEVPRLLQIFVIMVKTQYGKDVKTIRSDNGQEFLGPMKQFYQQKRIIHQTTCVDTPQQNGRPKRKHRHILNVARALRFQAHLPLDFWGESILTAGYLINRTPSNILNGKTPFEVLFGVKPSYDHVKMFGCLCYAHIKSRSEDKFASRSRKCVFCLLYTSPSPRD